MEEASSQSDTTTINEAIHHKTIAESKFNSNDLTSALNHAQKAYTLSPNTESLSSMVTALETITSASVGDTPDWYTILKVEPFSDMDTIKQQYRKLALLLHPDKNPYPWCEEGFKLVSEAFKVLSDKVKRAEYDMKLKSKIQVRDETATFFTVCCGCKSVHKFDKKYLGHYLICPNCKISFEGREGSENGASSSNSKIIMYSRRKKRVSDDSKRETVEEDDEGTMTLAEMQSVIKKKKPKKKTEDVPRVDKKRERGKMSQKLYIEDVDNDFSKDRMPRRFKKGQVWAIYDGGEDKMPRSYCLVLEVVSLNPFKVWISWLDFDSEREKLISLSISSHIACGRFHVSEKVLIEQVRPFSHIVNCERVAREVYRIYPRKGSVWAVYADATSSGLQRRKSRRYEIVVCLTMYNDAYGLSVAYLEKVEECGNLFKRRDYGYKAVKWVEKDDVAGLLSHQIPAKKLSEDGAGLKESWLLDLASVPPGLVSAA